MQPVSNSAALLAEELLIVPSGLPLNDTSAESVVVPGCCSGLEDWAHESVSRGRVYQLARRADLPQPVAELTQGKVWARADIEVWVETHRTGERR